MILRKNKSIKSIAIAIIASLVVIVLSVNYLNFRIILEDIRETIHSYEPGLSRFISWDDSLSPGSKFQYAIKKISKAVFLKSYRSESQISEELFINMTFENHQQLLNDRAVAIDLGLLHNSKDVNAIIIYEGESYKAKVRLKGDLPDHWLSQHRMSLRVKLKKGKTIFGLNEFNIQKPRSRAFPYDSVFQKLVQKAGLLAIQHNYARINFNGISWGVMDIESHISKEFIESEQRKDSLVVRFSNEDGWRYIRSSLEPDKNYRISSPEFYLKLYSAKSKLEDEVNRDRYSYIANQRLKGSPDLYDLESYFNLLLFAEYWGTDHFLFVNNLRHYFNPYTLKLEAISSDQVEPRENDFSCSEDFIFTSSKLFSDISKADLFEYNIEENINLIEKTLKLNKEILFKHEQSFFPKDDIAPTNLIKSKDELLSLVSIRPYLDRAVCREQKTYANIEDSFNYTDHVHVRHYANGEVEIFNLLNHNVEVISIQDTKGNLYAVNTIIPGYLSKEYSPLKIKTNFIGNYDSSLSVISRHNGQLRQTTLYITIKNQETDNPLLADTPNNLKFLQTEDNLNWVIKKGSWNVNYPLVINGNLKIEEGTLLSFSKESYLVVKGNLTSLATAKNKISLSSQNDSWKGLYVLNAPEESILRHTSIKNVTSVNDGILKLTGGVTFYNSDVLMENVDLYNGLDEDLLNIVNSKYNLINISLNGAKSDAIDFDFSEGKIENIKLSNIGGDALDFSGGSSIISKADIFKVTDKAVSAGEEASVEIIDSKINDIGVGIASKDGSKVFALNISIGDSQLAPAMTYIKKEFYGFPKLHINSSIMNINGLIAQTGSDIFIDGVKLKTQKINVEELYQSSIMKK